jgi:site-specific recombinase XerD
MNGDELRMLREFQRAYPDSPFIFVSPTATGLVQLKTAGAFKMIRRAATAANLEGLKIHPHMLRHSCGHAMANKGVDTRAIQAYLGHKKIQHTVVYTNFAEGRFNGFEKLF